MCKTGGGTSNLLDHIRRHHREVLNGADVPHQQEHVFYSESSPRKNELDKMLIRLVAQDYQPFRIVDDLGFKAFLGKLDPRYKLPCRQSIANVSWIPVGF